MSPAEEWDVPLPGLEPEAPKQQRQRSAKQDHDAKHKIAYRRRAKGARHMPCDECVAERWKAVSIPGGPPPPSLNGAAYVRLHAGEEKFLCMGHTQQARDRDELDGLSKGK